MSPIERLQLDLEAKLNSLEYFADIAAHAIAPASDGSYGFVDAQRNMAQAGELAKAGKYGAAAFIGEPYFDNEHPNLPGVSGRIITPIEVIEHRQANMIVSTGTRKSADEIALRIARSLSNFRTQAGQQESVDYTLGSCFTEKGAISPDENPNGPTKRRVVIVFTPFAQNKPTTCIDVAMTVGANVTLTTGTAGATTYYTTNGELPWSGGPGVQVYAAPFATPASGTTIRAAAYKAGLDGSNITTRVIP